MADSITLDYFKSIILACFPELVHSSFTLLTAGWDSIAVDVDNRLIFKFPREEVAAQAPVQLKDLAGMLR